MKTTSLSIIGILMLNFSWAQNKNLDYSKSLKVYSHQYFSTEKQETNNDSVTLYSTESVNQLFKPTFAFQWKTKKNNFKEIQLVDYTILKSGNSIGMQNNIPNQVSSLYRTKSTSLALLLEYMYVFNKEQDSKLIPAVGFGVSPYFKQLDSKSLLSTSFKTMDRSFGVKADIIPRLIYHLNSKLYFDLNIPLNLMNFGLQSSTYDNPILPITQRNITRFDFKTFSSVGLNVGLGFKF